VQERRRKMATNLTAFATEMMSPSVVHHSSSSIDVGIKRPHLLSDPEALRIERETRAFETRIQGQRTMGLGSLSSQWIQVDFEALRMGQMIEQWITEAIESL